ncbi:MAG: hypothetical protein AB7T49_19105 [Oligoflexales bacterium]
MLNTKILSLSLVLGVSALSIKCKEEASTERYRTPNPQGANQTSNVAVAWDPNIKSMFVASCEGAACHSSTELKSGLQTSYDGVKSNFDKMLGTVDGLTKRMPPVTATDKVALSATQIADLKKWRDGGFLQTQIGTQQTNNTNNTGYNTNTNSQNNGDINNNNQNTGTVSFTASLRSDLDSGCGGGDCHGSGGKEAKEYEVDYADTKSRFEKVLGEIEDGKMPPKSASRSIDKEALVKKLQDWETAGFLEN